jgi:hypothetical protein
LPADPTIATVFSVGAPVVAHRCLEQRDPKHVRRLLQRDVRGDRDDHFRGGDPLLDAAALAIDEHRVDQALGAAEGDDTTHLVALVVLRDGLTVEQRRGHGDNLALELGCARIHVALQHIRVGEQPVRLGEELVVIVTAVIDGARYAPGIPHLVFLGRHRTEFGEDALPRPRFGRDPVVGLEAVAVGVEVDECREVLRAVLLFVGLLGLRRFLGHAVFLHRGRIVHEARSWA